MPEAPNAYRCDYCHTLMEPVEQNDGRWHTKWCSKCGAKLYDIFIGESHTEVPTRSDPWGDENAEAGIK